MTATQRDQDKADVQDPILKLPVSKDENDADVEDLEDSSSIVYSQLDEEEKLNTSELPDAGVAHSSHAVYGYEDAAPQVQQRNLQRKPYRRNSIVDQIMTWAGAIRDDDFYNSSYNNKTQNTRSIEEQGSRRASVHGSTPTTQGNSLPIGNPLRQRVASSDDVALLDLDDDLEQADDEDDWNLEDGDDGFRRLHDHAPRRNSLHAMVERAMAHVNLRQNYDDDDLTPFGNRRDSLF